MQFAKTFTVIFSQNHMRLFIRRFSYKNRFVLRSIIIIIFYITINFKCLNGFKYRYLRVLSEIKSSLEIICEICK